MFKSITKRSFGVNLLAVIALAILLVFVFLQLLSWLTRHGEHLTVPDVKKKNTEEAIKLLENQGFDVMIQDSVYTDTLPNGTVIKQLPDPGATVKVNRTVFLTVNRVIPPMVDMPNLEGKTLDFAMDILAKDHLDLGDTIYKTSFMKGSVLEQLYNGKKIAPGTQVQWGSDITLVVGAGLAEENIIVPDLLGKTYGESKQILDSLGIIYVPVPDETVSGTDTADTYIVKQRPAHLDETNKLVYIKSGMFMDIWLSKNKVILQDSVANKITN